MANQVLVEASELSIAFWLIVHLSSPLDYHLCPNKRWEIDHFPYHELHRWDFSFGN